jgi:DNA polymerase III subunit delta'
MLFKDITGQQEIKKQLVRTVSESRVSHAQLFLGPEGCGKLSMAIAYAQFINCKNKLENDACGVCPSCVKYQKLQHPDLHFIYPVATTSTIKSKPKSKDFIVEWRKLLIENNGYINLAGWFNSIGIENKQGIINAEDCADIIRTLSYKSYESEYKVMIIWMVEKLFHAAGPKLLKILEEPPDKTLFILISENQDQIINTILSRTQVVKFPRIKNKDLNLFLIESNKLSETNANHILTHAEGNMFKAMRLQTDDDKEKQNFDLFVLWMRTCYAYNLAGINDFVNKTAKIGREKQKGFLLLATRVLRNSILMNQGLDKIASIGQNETDFMKKFHPFMNPNNGPLLMDEFNKAIFHIERNANPSIVFMDLSLKVSLIIKAK